MTIKSNKKFLITLQTGRKQRKKSWWNQKTYFQTKKKQTRQSWTFWLEGNGMTFISGWTFCLLLCVMNVIAMEKSTLVQSAHWVNNKHQSRTFPIAILLCWIIQSSEIRTRVRSHQKEDWNEPQALPGEDFDLFRVIESGCDFFFISHHLQDATRFYLGLNNVIRNPALVIWFWIFANKRHLLGICHPIKRIFMICRDLGWNAQIYEP